MKSKQLLTNFHTIILKIFYFLSHRAPCLLKINMYLCPVFRTGSNEKTDKPHANTYFSSYPIYDKSQVVIYLLANVF